jgi:hypothetical protein
MLLICSGGMDEEERVRRKFEALSPVMNERMTRLWLAAEARALGRGGPALVERATGIRGKRIYAGLRDLDEIERSPGSSLVGERIRRPGGGRPSLTETYPDILTELESLVDPVTRGDPESPLRWTCKSLNKLADELCAKGYKISPSKIGHLLHDLGYSLQANDKTREGSDHPDRNAQFEYINAQAEGFLAAGEPVISVDTKKKELVGDFENQGREWQPKGEPEPVRVHDFIDKDLGKAIPYGIYDIARNEAMVNVGTDHDTAEFAAASILQWWKTMGRKAYPNAQELLITADGGGSNASRSRLWKVALQDFADRTGLVVTVCHLPPGTSKWNKIEHRLFSHISQNWRGRPLQTLDTIVQLIAATTTRAGLRVRARADRNRYETGIVVSDAAMRDLEIERHEFHGEWNYTLTPRV